MSQTDLSTSSSPPANQGLARGGMVGSADAFFEVFNASIPFDYRLWEQDIKQSQAHASMLLDCDIISQQDHQTLQQGLLKVADLIRQETWSWDLSLEDVHMNIEAALISQVGEVGKKLHTARSRNDQVATVYRLYLAEQQSDVLELLAGLASDLCIKADTYAEVIMPGFTHLQAAQPITFGHHLMAWEQMFSRDYQRIQSSRQQALARCPLGAGALAGTPHPINPALTAAALGFAQPVQNSLDSVSDRDFVIECGQNLALIATHLSRCAEDVILWMSPGYQMLSLDESICASSSIMPQKQNPDLAELVRGKSARVIAASQGLLIMLKSQAMGYNKDNQEDKEMMFDALSTVKDILQAWRLLVQSMIPQPERMQQVAAMGHSTATDLADLLVSRYQLAFRQAYREVGALVKIATQLGCELSQLPLEKAQAVNSHIQAEDLQSLNVKSAVQARSSLGGTNPTNVRNLAAAQLKFWLKAQAQHDGS